MLHKHLKKILCASALSITALQAQLLVPSPDAMIHLHMGDIEYSMEKWEVSPFGELWDSKEMASFRKPFDTWMDNGLEKLQQELHLDDTPELSDLFTGELLFSLENFDFSGDDFKQMSTQVYLAFQCDEDSDLLEAIKDQLLEKMKKNKKSKRRDVTFMGHLFHTQDIPQEKSADQPTFQKGLELRFGIMDDIAYIGVASKKKHEEVIRRILSSRKGWKKKADEAPEMTFSMNMEGINALILKALAEDQKKQKDAPPQPGPAMFLQGMDFGKVFQGLGLLDFNTISMATAEHPDFEKLDTTVTMNQTPRGFVSMFVPNAKTHLGAIPQWIPEDVLTYQGTAIPVSTWFDTIMTFLKQELPMFAPMVEMQLGNIEQSMGLNLKRDLFDQFGDQFYQVGFEQDKNTPLEQVGQATTVFTLKDGDTVEKNLFKLLAMAPMPKLEPVKYMGGQYYTIGPKTDGLQATMAFHKNHFLFAQSPDDIKKVIRLINKPNSKSLAKSKAFSVYKKLLPDRYQQLSFQNLDRSILSIFNLLKANQPMIAMTMANWPFQLDFSKLPGKESFHGQFGDVMSFTVSKGTVIHAEAFSKKVEME